ncbi:MAG: HlyD family secretion protein [Halioglobus sp.]|nr:HlyD family secretion protein [Halioglobus sp.]
MPVSGDNATDPGGGSATFSPPRQTVANRHRWLRRALYALLALGAVAGFYVYHHYREIHPRTSDAYLNAHVLQIAPRVHGQVLRVPIDSHQSVTQGQLLLEIDPAPFEIAIERAEAQEELARQQAAAAASTVNAARAEVARQQAALDNARLETQRIRKLVAQGSLPTARGDDADASLKQAAAALVSSRAQLQRAVDQLGQAGVHNASIRAAVARLAEAKLQLSYTRITAPAAAVAGEIAVRPGAVVEPGQVLFPMVERGSFWVDANFKETDLEHIRPGQPATVSVDIYPDKTFRATVASISPASGSAFSLLPPRTPPATGSR